MKNSRDKNFFQNIRRNVKVSFFVSSIIPLALLAYISLKYIYPHMEMPFYFIMLLSLTVIVSVLGLFLLTETTNTSIISLQGLYEKLNSLVKITKHLRATTYLDVLLKDITTAAMRLNSAETCSLLLFDEGGNLRYKVSTGEHAKSLKDKIIKHGEGFSGWVVSTGEPLLANEAANDNRYNPDIARAAGITTRSALCVPLVHDEKVIGVIELLNKKEGAFTSEDEQLLSSLADQAAISITQSRLYENQKRDTIHMTEIFVNAQDANIPQKKRTCEKGSKVC